LGISAAARFFSQHFREQLASGREGGEQDFDRLRFFFFQLFSVFGQEYLHRFAV
jgi:hypothetical protein